MWIITAVRDFAQGLARGLSLFLTDRRDFDERLTIPEAGWAKCLHEGRSGTGGAKPESR